MSEERTEYASEVRTYAMVRLTKTWTEKECKVPPLKDPVYPFPRLPVVGEYLSPSYHGLCFRVDRVVHIPHQPREHMENIRRPGRETAVIAPIEALIFVTRDDDKDLQDLESTLGPREEYVDDDHRPPNKPK